MKTEITENFFVDGEFYESLGEYMEAHEIDEETIEDQPDFIRVVKGQLEPLVTIDADWILERVDDERYSENGDEAERVFKALKLIDFTAANLAMPKMWYSSYEKGEITKAQMYEYLK